MQSKRSRISLPLLKYKCSWLGFDLPAYESKALTKPLLLPSTKCNDSDSPKG